MSQHRASTGDDRNSLPSGNIAFCSASAEITTSGAPCDTRLTLSLVREGANLPTPPYVLGADDPVEYHKPPACGRFPTRTDKR